MASTEVRNESLNVSMLVGGCMVFATQETLQQGC